MNKPKTMKINDVDYVRADSIQEMAKSTTEGYRYVITRARNSGCHAGYLKNRKGAECELINSRRLWSWSGASTLSQLAVDGTNDVDNCKFPCAVPELILTDVCEFLFCTEQARKSIQGVKIWQQ